MTTFGPRNASGSPCVLVVEDEEKTRQSVAEAFALEQWRACPVGDGEAAIHVVREGRVDLVVMDWMLPDCEGPMLVRQLRAGCLAPVIMLTARDAVPDRVVGLEAGADDYLAKPFAFAELLARSRALLRRTQPAPPRRMTCGDLSLDARARLAWRGRESIALTPREVDLLDYLLQAQGQVVTREMLQRDVWRQPSRLTSLDNVIDVQMMRLRRKLELAGRARLLHTVRGIGYRLSPPAA